jgi:hypothetical protein
MSAPTICTCAHTACPHTKSHVKVMNDAGAAMVQRWLRVVPLHGVRAWHNCRSAPAGPCCGVSTHLLVEHAVPRVLWLVCGARVCLWEERVRTADAVTRHGCFRAERRTLLKEKPVPMG